MDKSQYDFYLDLRKYGSTDMPDSVLDLKDA